MLMVKPVPELEPIVLASSWMWQLFHEETPSPRALWIALRASVTRPLFATTFAPQREKAIVFDSASSRPR